MKFFCILNILFYATKVSLPFSILYQSRDDNFLDWAVLRNVCRLYHAKGAKTTTTSESKEIYKIAANNLPNEICILANNLHSFEKETACSEKIGC